MSSKNRSASASTSKKSSVSPAVSSVRRLLRETLKQQPQQNINSNCDPGEQQTPNRNTAEESSKPYVRIVEQPAAKSFIFRYSSESQTTPRLLGENWCPIRETYPAIEILNHKERAVVIISCVTKDAPYKPHPYNIISKEGYIHGVCVLQIPHRAEFQSLGIKRINRDDFEKALKKRESIRVDPFKTGFSHRSFPSCIDLNVVRLCFQVFIADENGHFTVPLKPVVTNPIYDKRSLLPLAIHEMCSSGSVLGGTEIILLCKKIVKEDTSVRFYEKQIGVTTWEAFGSFEMYNVHRQSSIRSRTPRYHNINITKPVTVFVQLVRTSDGIASDPVRFTYNPVEPESNRMLLRRKCERIGLNPQVNIPLKLENAPGGVSFPLFNFNIPQWTPPLEVVSPSYNSNQSNTSSSSAPSSAPSSPSSSSSTLYLPSPAPSPSLHTMVTGRNTSSIPAFIAAKGGGYPPETKQVPIEVNKPNESGMDGACQQLQQQQQQHQTKLEYLALQEIQQSIPPLGMPNEQQHYQQPQQQSMLQYLSLQESQQATPPQNMPIVQQHYQQPWPQPQLQQQQEQTRLQYLALQETQQPTPLQNMSLVQQHYLQPQPLNQTQPNVSSSTNKTSWEQQFANIVLFASSALSNLNGKSSEANLRNLMAATASGIIQHEQQQQQPRHYEQYLSPTQQQQYQPLQTEPQRESQSQMSLQQQLINNEMIMKPDADVGSSDIVGDDDGDETITTL